MPEHPTQLVGEAREGGEVAPPVLSGAVPEAFAAGDGGDVLGQMFAQSGSTSGADVVSL